VELLNEFLEGPTAIAFVNGDVSAVARALRDFAKATPTLVVKGGVLDGMALSLRDFAALADLPSRDALLASLLGLLSSPLTTMAALLGAIPQNFAYGLSALIDSKGGVVVAPAPVETKEIAETPAGVEEAASAASDDAGTVVAAVAVEAPVADADSDTPEASEDAAGEPANSPTTK
jgi:large subunit ribosomal protein L10